MSYPATWVWQVSRQTATGACVAEKPHQFGDLVEAAAQRAFGAGGVLDEKGEAGALPGNAVHGALDGFGGEFQADVAAEAFPGAGMEDEVIGAQRKCALDFAAEAGNTLLANQLGLAADVYQVAGVNRKRRDVVFGAELVHALGLRGVNGRRAPHARAGGEDLEGVGAELRERA